MRLLSNHFRFSEDPVGLAGVLYAARDIPETRGERRWEVDTLDTPRMGEEEFNGRVATMKMTGCRVVQIRGIDLAYIEENPEIQGMRSLLPIRGFCTGSSPRTEAFYAIDYVTVRVQIPLLSDYTEAYGNYVKSYFGISAHLLRDRLLNYVYTTFSKKGNSIEIPFLYSFSEEEREETLGRLSFCQSQIRFPKQKKKDEKRRLWT